MYKPPGLFVHIVFWSIICTGLWWLARRSWSRYRYRACQRRVLPDHLDRYLKAAAADLQEAINHPVPRLLVHQANTELKLVLIEMDCARPLDFPLTAEADLRRLVGELDKLFCSFDDRVYVQGAARALMQLEKIQAYLLYHTSLICGK